MTEMGAIEMIRVISMFFSVILTAGMLAHCASGQDDYRDTRQWMVDTQIKRRGITDQRVLEALRNVRRHVFIPGVAGIEAYDDSPRPIGHGQTISQPYIVAYMTEALKLKRDDRILEIGTGSGYQAAVLAEIVDSVFTIEIVPELAEHARTVLDAEGYDNVQVKTGDGYAGWPEHAPYDGIIVTCAPENIPAALKEQLVEGGVMIIPVGPTYGVQYLVRVVKRNGRIEKTNELPVRFVPMVNGEE